MRQFDSLQSMQACVGQEIAVSEWVTIDQRRIDLFAEATGDHQWIHVDPKRAADGPYGSTIAHGYLTLALIPMLTAQAIPPTKKLGWGFFPPKMVCTLTISF